MRQHHTSPAPNDREKVEQAFEEIATRTPAESERIRALARAFVSGDHDTARSELERTRLETSWLYEELMEHPEISALMRELSILGL